MQADPEKAGDPNLVTWYGPNDPENPYNWSTWYKSFVAVQMSFLTFAVYVGSSIYSSGISGPNTDSITNVFDVSQTSGLVGLTVFVLGYGIGPMLWSPLTEFPSVGRLPVYIGTLLVFVALQFPTIYANNIHTLLAMRFLAGFFGSPCLAVGGATMGDMFAPKHLAYALGVWGCGAVSGPVFGPLLGGFTYQAKGWTWPLWVLTWLSGFSLVLSVIFFPETSGKTILHHRAARLRRLTGNTKLRTQAEIEAHDRSPSSVVKEVLWRPFELFFEPTLLVYNTYLALIYGLLYIWFESYPLVFAEIHGFNPGETGLAFMGIFVGAWLACGVFCIYIHIRLEPIFDANNGSIPCPEIRLYPAPIAAVCIPIAMFGFGWTGQYESVHWIVPIIFTGFFGVGAFILFQCIFAYFGDVYYAEIGSVLTLNDLFRSTWGAAFPLFANALFSHLGIGGGNSLLGGLACLFIPFPFLFIKYGARIRSRSKYAAQDKN
ncbi:MFS general substrate transporter [Papiliotrema laurentii]|uniref:MFS general substrate transporter n=1 Tax=Papiliotrema laurentii TaxID=5418 RepID=A0AAD9FSK5_PAPLA|nr:MFS general substrate transporter [Papiliotrema laurentii]